MNDPALFGMLGLPAPEWKGDFDKASWMGRFAECFIIAGAEADEAWEAAAIAWDCSPDDADPDEAASAELAYSMEDAT